MFSENFHSGLSAVHSMSQINIHEYEINHRFFRYNTNGLFAGVRMYNNISVLFKSRFFHHRDNGFIFHKKDCFGIIICHSDVILVASCTLYLPVPGNIT